MTSLDDRIRSLVHDRVSEAPAPLSAADMEARITFVNVVPMPPRRRTWVAVAVGVAAALVLTTVLAWRADRHYTGPASPHLPADQLQLPRVPDGWTVLDLTETVSPAGEGTTQVAVYTRSDPAATLVLRYSPNSQGTPGDQHRFESAVGPGSWSAGCSGACFNLNPAAGGQVQGDLTLTDDLEGSVLEIAAHLSVAADGTLMLDRASGYALSRAGRTAEAPTVELSLWLGQVGGSGVAWFSITGGDDVLDASLMGGADAAATVVDGQTYWVDGSRAGAHWSRNGARYSVFGAPDIDALAIATSVAPASDADLTRLAANIGEDAEVTDSVDVDVARRALRFEERQQGRWTFVCLGDGHARVCRNIQSGGYTSVLLDGHWYVVQAYQSDIAIPNTGNVVVGRSKWRVTAIADNFDTVKLGNPGQSESLTRPTW